MGVARNSASGAVVRQHGAGDGGHQRPMVAGIMDRDGVWVDLRSDGTESVCSGADWEYGAGTPVAPADVAGVAGSGVWGDGAGGGVRDGGAQDGGVDGGAVVVGDGGDWGGDGAVGDL